MELIRGIHNLRPSHRGCVATIGNFDGVHRGHRVIIDQVLAISKKRCLPSLIMLFEPQPSEFFAGNRAPARLMRLRDKVTTLKSLGVDRVLCIQFNRFFRGLSADAFIKELLVDKLGIKHLVVGDDFRFGQGRAGDFSALQQAGLQYEFEVENTATSQHEGKRISSTLIREALHNGQFDQAAKLLGHPYRLAGRVAYGDQLGRQLGVPTANIALHRNRSPLLGVYAVEMLGVGDSPIKGVANIGHRPSVNGVDERLEVHLLNFNGDIYGQYVSVQFLKRLRDEKKFDDLDILKAAIKKDIKRAELFFNNSRSANK